MKLKSLVALAMLAGGVQSADAALLLYQLAGTFPGKFTASFTLDTTRAPSIVLPTSVRYNGVHVTFTRPNSTIVETAAFSNTGPTFQVLNNQGGVFLGFLGNAVPFQTGFAVYGPQLFSGTTAAPIFLTGAFDLSDVPRSRLTDPLQVNYRLTVTDVTGAVPEPATWAMMLVGFGAIGIATRRRNAAVRVTFAG